VLRVFALCTWSTINIVVVIIIIIMESTVEPRYVLQVAYPTGKNYKTTTYW